MPIAGVVADANVLLSAAVGKSALRVITDFSVEVHVSELNADEVSEYLPEMADKYRLPVELVRLQRRLLPLRFHREKDYAAELASAVAALKDRDPDDAHVLALAKTIKFPIWSNDRDLARVGVECFTTARLLRILQG